MKKFFILILGSFILTSCINMGSNQQDIKATGEEVSSDTTFVTYGDVVSENIAINTEKEIESQGELQ